MLSELLRPVSLGDLSPSTESWSTEVLGLSAVLVEIREVTAGAGVGRLPKMDGRNERPPPLDEWEPED